MGQKKVNLRFETVEICVILSEIRIEEGVWFGNQMGEKPGKRNK